MSPTPLSLKPSVHISDRHRAIQEANGKSAAIAENLDTLERALLNVTSGALIPDDINSRIAANRAEQIRTALANFDEIVAVMRSDIEITLERTAGLVDELAEEERLAAEAAAEQARKDEFEASVQARVRRLEAERRQAIEDEAREAEAKRRQEIEDEASRALAKTGGK